ncbi:hypothetical protein ASG33_14720 [Dyadobacter sp. Leaf189]|nr:hypothetical protein ASG33_14720 [Dyadobacter sp. Leaf189]
MLPGRVEDLFVPGTAVGSVVVRGTLSVDCVVPGVVLPGIVVRCGVVPVGCVVLPGKVPVDCVVLPGCDVPGNVPGCTVLPGTVLGCVLDPALPVPVVGDVVEVAGVVCAKATVVPNNANPNMFIFNAFMTFIIK